MVGKDDTQAYRGARVKRTMVTAVECISTYTGKWVGVGLGLGSDIIQPNPNPTPTQIFDASMGVE
jgi:hypothetical protein